ncbi:MAG: hypothetical protein Q4F70_05150 [Clostridia bacterium]|nr:hypothetical protein [Clostridia bacterium]
MKGNRAVRLVATLVVVTILAMSLTLFAFAGGSTYSIPEGTKVVTAGMVPDDATVVNIPSSVVSIESGALANCTALDTVNIDNVSGSVTYDASAFYGGTISVHYLKAKLEYVTAAKPEAQESTTAETTEPETEVVTDSTPFAAAKEDLSGVNIWSDLVSNAGDKETSNSSSDTYTKIVAYVAAISTVFGGVMIYIDKFKK